MFSVNCTKLPFETITNGLILRTTSVSLWKVVQLVQLPTRLTIFIKKYPSQLPLVKPHASGELYDVYL